MNNLILTLLNIPKIGKKSIHYFIEEMNCLPQDKEEIIEIFKRIQSEHKRIIIPSKEQLEIANEKANNIILKSSKHNIKAIDILDEKFPRILKTIDDEPVVLFYKGNIDCINNDNIAIVGSREADQDGLQVSYNLGRLFAQRGYNIVSGLALGCDTYAHKGALSIKKSTTAVMPCGLDMVYPLQNENLAQDIIDNNGCLISEYDIESIIYKNNFIQRDRIQSGLSLAVVVAQGNINSGTSHTVEYALKQKRILSCFDINSSLNQDLIKEKNCIKITEDYNIENIEKEIKVRQKYIYDNLKTEKQLRFEK